MNQANVKVSFYLKKSEADADGNALYTKTSQEMPG